MLKLTVGPFHEGLIEISPRPPSRSRAFPRFFVSGPRSFIINVAQQLAWLMTVFRKPVYGQLSSSDIYIRRTGPQTFKIQALELRAVRDGQSSCWTPLFLNSVLAMDFPIQPRIWGLGVELSFQMMTCLAGVQFSAKYKHGIYLRGSSTLLFPTDANTEAVQWHLVVSKPGNPRILDGKIAYQEWHKINEENRLLRARTFLGVYRKATVHLGTAGFGTGDVDVVYSAANHEKPSAGLWPDTVQIGTSGMGVFGAQVTAKMSKTRGLSASGLQDSFESMLATAKAFPIILFDTHCNDRRGWLVSATGVMLHMVHVWARNQSLKVELSCADAAADGGLAAYKAIDNGAELVLRQKNSTLAAGHSVRREEKYRLKDLVTTLWFQLRSLEDRETLHRENEGPVVRSKRRRKLCGWEFMDVVNSASVLYRKEVDCRPQWLPLTEDILVLFGNNFGSVIRPAPGLPICGAWNPIPCERNYLTASVPCLRRLSNKWGTGRTCARLTNDQYWIPQADPFGDCEQCCAKDTNVRCHKQAQQLSEKPTDEVLTSPPVDGAVTFGNPQKPQKHLSYFGIGAKANHTNSTSKAKFVYRSQRHKQGGNPSRVSEIGPVELLPSQKPFGNLNADFEQSTKHLP
jgi:hypothetical protein